MISVKAQGLDYYAVKGADINEFSGERNSQTSGWRWIRVKGEGVHTPPRIMRLVIREPQDPLVAQHFTGLHFLGAGRNVSFHRSLPPPWKPIKPVLLKTTI